MSYNTELQSNNAELQEILDAVNDLPDAGSGDKSTALIEGLLQHGKITMLFLLVVVRFIDTRL